MSNALLLVLLGLSILAVIGLVIGLVLQYQKSRALEAKYSPIIHAEDEVRRANEEATRLRSSAETDVARLRSDAQLEVDRWRSEATGAVVAQKQQLETLSQEYGTARTLYDRLRAEVSLLEENLEETAVGLYKPHYEYDSSEKYREALEDIRAKQKDLIKLGTAAICGTSWQIQGDSRAGERMTKQYLKLILRAFNGECDAAVAKVSWNNITKMEERIRKTYDAINDFGQVMQMRIAPAYLDLKLAELRLEYETEQKKREEQEEQRRIKEQMREEERARREAEKAKEDAEEEEARYEKALQKARAEIAEARGEALEVLQMKIQHLDAALHKAHELKEKAICMAQLTRSGHVYVISNVGSFGENIFKIGMTRRLEPMDRIKELGDASVPFDFDVHAMVYCVDAPALECELQTKFEARAVNLVNPRKEFFAVSIDDIEAFVREKNLNVTLTKLAEARDYRETLAKRAEAARVFASTAVPVDVAQFPPTLPTATQVPRESAN